MRVTAQVVEAGSEEAAFICAVTEAGVLVKNTGEARVFLGGPDVAAGGEQEGYPLDPGESQVFAAPEARESPSVPAPEGDMAPARLHARTADGTAVRVAWIAAG